MSTPTKHSVTVKAAWINVVGYIAAAITTALLGALFAALLRPSPRLSFHAVPKDAPVAATTHPAYPLPHEIAAERARVPPFQRSEVAKHYEGLKVSWEVYLDSVETVGPNSVNVDFQDPTGGPPSGTRCNNIPLADNPELKILKGGARLRVDGIITGVEEIAPHFRVVV